MDPNKEELAAVEKIYKDRTTPPDLLRENIMSKIKTQYK